MPKFELGVEPQCQYTPPSKQRCTSPYGYDDCPQCGGRKAERSKTCRQCRTFNNRPPVDLVTYESEHGPYRRLAITLGLYVLVDASLYDFLLRWTWYAHFGKTVKSYYARAAAEDSDGKTVPIMMHQLLLGLTASDVGDHINHDTLDNRLFNLRVANRKQSASYRRKAAGKSSKFIGVAWHKRSGMWRARIAHYGKTLELGLFQSEEEAARERDRVAIKLHGDFAVLNFPRGDYD